MANDAWDLGGGGESFQFDNINDEIEGYILDMADRQGTDMQTGELLWWDKERTRPQMLKVVTLQTTLKNNPADDGKRNITLSGSKKPNPDGTMSRMAAALKAVKDATGGGTTFQFQAWFKMRFTSEGARTKPGFNPPKYYQAWYRPPVMDLDGADRTAPANQVAGQYGGQPGGGVASGANWPVATTTGPEWAQTSGGTQAPVAQGGTLAGEPITQGAVEAIRKAGMNPDTVFGPGWQARVTG